MPLLIDTHALPLVKLAYVGEFTDDELSAFLGQMDSVLELPGRKVCLMDLRTATTGTAKQRSMQGKWIATNEDIIAREFLAAALVTDRAIIRGTITAIFWIRPLPIPTHVAASLAAAEQWLAPYLARAGP